MSGVLLQLGLPVGIGAAGEFVAGYAAKKIGKFVAVIVGLFTAALICLSVKGIISMNYETLWNSLAGSLGLASLAFSWIDGVYISPSIRGKLRCCFSAWFQVRIAK